MNIEKLYDDMKKWSDSIKSEGMIITASEIDKWVQELKEEIYLKYEKATGRSSEKTILSAAKKILKRAQKLPQKRMHGIYTEEIKPFDIRYIVCDGYRCVRFKDALPLPEIAENYKNDIFITARICNKGRDAKELTLPTIADLKIFIKDMGKDEPFCLDEDLQLYCNPSYLIDMMECLPGCTAWATDAVSLIYFSANNGDGCLMPCRPKRK